MRPLRVLLVTSWNIPCGIAEHSAQLKAAVEAADPGIEILPDSTVLGTPITRVKGVDLVHLNHHDALHHAWTADHVRALTQHVPVLVTYHDTFGEIAPADMTDGRLARCQAFYEAATAFVVHEPCKGLDRARVWRQGVPAAQMPYIDWGTQPWPMQPVLGTIGFPAPHKNFPGIARGAQQAGWGCLIISPAMPQGMQDEVRAAHPYAVIRTDYPSSAQIVQLLTGCAATCFFYTSAYAGTSAAVRWGIAARRPVLLNQQRQVRDLQLAWLPAFHWIPDLEESLAATLQFLPITGHPYAPMVRVADTDSWERLGHRYAALYRELV